MSKKAQADAEDSDLVVIETGHKEIELLSLPQDRALDVLARSLYPGAKRESILLVLDYCRAARLDPMLKPVHIVTMKVSTGKKTEKGYDIKEETDVIMPGVGLYRTNAARTGQYGGISEPTFGPNRELSFQEDVWEDGDNGKRVKRKVDGVLEYPEWCKVTVTRIVAGTPREFTAQEYWLENYATKGDGPAPNAMWRKRPRAQLVKCTEAQALRKAFPEQTGSQPTADEMEGKEFDGRTLAHDPPDAGSRPAIQMPKEKEAPKAEVIDHSTGEIINPAKSTATSSQRPADEARSEGIKLDGGPPVSPGMRKTLKAKLANQSQMDEAAICEHFGLQSLDLCPASRVNEVLKYLDQLAAE